MEKRVLLVGWGYPPNIDGGLDIHIKHLFDELKKDAEVKLAVPKERAPEREDVIGLETGDGDMIQKARKMSAEVADLAEDFDIVHTHDWFGAEAGFKAQKYSNADWVATFHSLSTSRSRKPWEELKRFENTMAEEADTLTAVSDKLATEVEEEYGKKPKVIHNGFSVPESSGIEVKNRLGVEGDMIFYVGRHSEQKGIEHLLYGFKKLLETQNATMVIGGEGEMTSSLKTFTEILEVEENVKFVGFISAEELGDYYRESDVFVSPSINEPFGLTITEALESGTPVVATTNGVEEIVSSGIISVEPESNSIAEGIKKALEKDREVPKDSRDWKEMTEDFLELYEEF
ncbi:MAG: glycosyltransferase family 4 protein [Nanohaloarchaea archaeon]|nr:glycosyltransferase family 4 protein [Candidatus Nanohaloarchaea archaeon]